MSERRPIVPALLVLALAAVLGSCSANKDKDG